MNKNPNAESPMWQKRKNLRAIAKASAETGEGNAPRNSTPTLREEILSDKSKVYNVEIEAETIYCLSEKHAFNFMRDLQQAIERATGIRQ